MSKLLELLQPKGYVSKIKLYCIDCQTEKFVKKFGEVNKNDYISRVKITEIKKL